jgi:hypothetical protein
MPIGYFGHNLNGKKSLTRRRNERIILKRILKTRARTGFILLKTCSNSRVINLRIPKSRQFLV